MDGLLALATHGRSSLPLDVLAGLTFLSIAPFVLVLSTSFVRIIVVLSLVRSAIGASSLPPNTVLTGLALVLTFVIMSPTIDRISHEAIDPYAAGKLTQAQFLTRATEPLRAFMLRQTKRKDLELFAHIAHRPPSEDIAAAPLGVLIPGFMVGELRSAFAIGVALYLPFVAIDLAVSAILMGLPKLWRYKALERTERFSILGLPKVHNRKDQLGPSISSFSDFLNFFKLEKSRTVP